MFERVAIIGAGYTPFRAVTPEISYREMIFDAAVKAYHDAGITPDDVSTFVSVTEDYIEGTAIADEYVPDQLGAVLKPVHTITTDGITGLASLVMQLQTGQFDIAVIEAHSKASNIDHPAHIEAFALDPVFLRPLALHPRFIAGLEMQQFLETTGNTPTQTAAVVVQNRAAALQNPLAAHPAQLTIADIMNSPPEAEPLKQAEAAQPADGAIVLVAARESIIPRTSGQPIYIRGIGWSQDTPNLEERDLSRAAYAQQAAARAYRMAGITNPAAQIHFAEIDDTFAYKQLQHLEALNLAPPGQSGRLQEQGHFAPNGPLPINPSGGAQGCGAAHDATGLRSILETVLQLRQTAGQRQLPNRPQTALAQSWRGLPTATGAVAILSAP